MTQPLVSAIVAAYNYDRFLARTLDSALSQDYPEDRLEIVVVDDGSTDSTPALLADYVARYPTRVRAFRQENAGYVAATNRAFEEARGQFWALLDADDLWPRDKTARQVEIFQARPEVGVVYGDLTVIDPEDRVLRPSHWQHDRVRPLRGPGALTPLLAGGNVAGASSIMVRSSLRTRFAPIPPAVPYVDWWVVMQVAAVAELEYLLEPRVGYREHGGNLTLGARGARLAREKIKQSLTRRHTLIAGGAAALPAEALVLAWSAVERDGFEAVQAAETVFIELPPTPPTWREAAATARARASALAERGRLEAALRCWLVAAAYDPFDPDARAAVNALGDALRANQSGVPDPLPQARAFAVLADARELVDNPQLLATFAHSFGADDDATLVIHAPGMAAEEVETALMAALDRAEVEPDTAADMVALPDPDSALDSAQLERAADMVLGSDMTDDLRERYEAAIAIVKSPRLD